MKMDLYKKVENVIQDHIKEHKAEVRKGKELMSKLDVVRCNQTEVTSKDWEQFWEDVWTTVFFELENISVPDIFLN